MKSAQLLKSALLIAVLVCLFPRPAMAYIGPGSGLYVIGTFIAVFFGLLVAMFGFLWYPAKRLIRMVVKRDDDESDEGDDGAE